jgi:hypothetical protein
MKIIRTLFSVRFAALVLVACTLFTGMMYRRQARELRAAEDHGSRCFDSALWLSKDVGRLQNYSTDLEERLRAYEATYPEPEGVPQSKSSVVTNRTCGASCPYR